MNTLMPQGLLGQQFHDEARGQAAGNKRDYWNEVVLFQKELMIAEFASWDSWRTPQIYMTRRARQKLEAAAGLAKGPKSFQPKFQIPLQLGDRQRYSQIVNLRQREITANYELTKLDMEIDRDSFFYAKKGTPHSESLVDEAREYVKQRNMYLKRLKTDAKREQYKTRIRALGAALSDGKRRLDQLQKGQWTPWKPDSSESPTHSDDDPEIPTHNPHRDLTMEDAVTQRIQLYTMQLSHNNAYESHKRGIVKDYLQELRKLETLLRRKQKTDIEAVWLGERKCEIRDFLRIVNPDSLASGQEGSSSSSSGGADSNGRAATQTGDIAVQGSDDHLQAEILEAQRALQGANSRWESARREKWDAEMLQSLMENAKAAKSRLAEVQRRLAVLEGSTQLKGKKKAKPDKGPLGRRRSKTLAT